jgi:hypothetical protein
MLIQRLMPADVPVRSIVGDGVMANRPLAE